METFRPEKVHYFRAKIDATSPRSFDDVVRYFQCECAFSRGNAIIAARRTYPNLSNAEMTLLHQHKGATPSHMRGSSGRVHLLSMRSSSGKPLVKIMGL